MSFHDQKILPAVRNMKQFDTFWTAHFHTGFCLTSTLDSWGCHQRGQIPWEKNVCARRFDPRN